MNRSDNAKLDALRLAAIITVQNEITAAGSDQDRVLHVIVSRCQSLTHATGAALDAVRGDELVYLAASGSASGHAGTKLPIATSLEGIAIRHTGIVACVDVQHDSRVDTALYRDLGIRSMIVAPVWRQGRVAAALKVISVEPRAFTYEDLHTLQIMAGLTGIALSRDTGEEGEAAAMAPASSALQMVHYQTLHDPLTELPNRTLLFDRLGQAISLARRQDAPLALLLLELDDFGGLIERHGHDVADDTLRDVAQRLEGTLRASDTVARIAAEEFVIVLAGANAIGALGIANKILRSLQAPFTVRGHSIQLSATAGIAMYPEHGADADTLMENADIATRRAKQTDTRALIFGS